MDYSYSDDDSSDRSQSEHAPTVAAASQRYPFAGDDPVCSLRPAYSLPADFKVHDNGLGSASEEDHNDVDSCVTTKREGEINREEGKN